VGDTKKDDLRVSFDSRVKLEFVGSKHQPVNNSTFCELGVGWAV
jgi:hypothetical protein